MRRVLRALAGVWLACQVVAAAAPLTLVSERFGIDQASCCPGVGPGQVCPMHHKRAGERTCQLESACAHHDAALLTILVVGVLPAPSLSLAPTARVASIASLIASARSRAAVPDAPPPESLSLL